MSNDYIKNADFDKVFALCKPFLEEAGRLTDKAEKLVELYKPQMTAAEEIVPLTDLFFEDFPELTEAEKEVMAGETVPTVLKAFKAKLEAMSDDEFVVENIFPQIKAVQKETGKVGLSRENHDYSFNYELPVNQWVELEFKNRKEYCFEQQLNWLTWFVILVGLKERGKMTDRSERKVYCRKLLNDPVVRRCPLKIQEFDVPEKQKNIVVYDKENWWWIIQPDLKGG